MLRMNAKPAAAAAARCPRALGGMSLPTPHLRVPARVARTRRCPVRALINADLQPVKRTQQHNTISSLFHANSSTDSTLQFLQQLQSRPGWQPADHERHDVKSAYKPPTSDLPGVAIATGLLTAWCLVFRYAVWQYDIGAPMTPLHLLEGISCFMAMEFLSTGLFITTHDAMHSAVAPNNKFLNDIIGSLCISLYAWFDYSKMHVKHWEHHNECGTPGADPDFHTGDTDALPGWFANFMKTYISIPQFVKLQACSTALMMYGGVPLTNLLLFWAGAGALSAGRLFYYGTWEPHHPDQQAWEEGEPAGSMPWWRARSSNAPRWLSFLRCYHFDYHWEHHMWPTAPWWDLPRAKAARAAVVGGTTEQQQREVVPQGVGELVPVPVLASAASGGLQRAGSGPLGGLVSYASSELQHALASLDNALCSYGSQDLAYASLEL